MHFSPQQPKCSNMCMMCPEKPIRDSGPKVFIGNWSCRHPLPSISTYSKFKLPEKKQMMGINHIICIVQAHGTTFISWGTVGTPQNPNSKMPAKSQPCQQVFLRRPVSGLLCYLFCAQGWKMKISKSPSNENRSSRERGKGLRDSGIDSAGFQSQGDTVSFGSQVRSLLTPTNLARGLIQQSQGQLGLLTLKWSQEFRA